ncbi:MAG: hypothetical protein P8Z30_11845 [Acidobacteriota bacterium]
MDVRFPDRDWKLVLCVAREALVPVQVIVACRIVDVHLYLDTLGPGAFDLVVPPFCRAGLDHIIVNTLQACPNSHLPGPAPGS